MGGVGPVPVGPLESIIVVTGLSCRFPGAADEHAFWRVLVEGRDAIGPMPPDRFDPVWFDDDAGPRAAGKVATRQGGFLTDIDRFDASFFGISPREAALMDPQHRLLLQTAWNALEDAGVTREDVRGSNTGVFAGVWTNDYERLVAPSKPGLDVDVFGTTGTGRYAAAGRLSYAFDLRGPSLVVDTACSSSLVALHLACQSLRAGECDLAIVAAANLILDPLISVAYTRSGLLSREGRCRFGDADAAGYVRSEGVAVLVLKPISLALLPHERVRAVIAGTAVNNDGLSSGSLMAPGRETQAELLRRAYANAGIDPRQVAYVEAHGTGTKVGDRTELSAIAEVVGAGRERACLVGSVKTNLGHTESVAGLAGLIKAILALEHRVLPPSLHVRQPTPALDWPHSSLELCTRRVGLDDPDPVIGVNTFGITGTNAHAVIRRPTIANVPSDTANDTCLVPLSAHSAESLEALSERWRAYDWTDVSFVDAAYTAATHRTHHAFRRAIVAAGFEDLASRLTRCSLPGPCDGATPSVVFVFPGQGGHWVGMGRRLLAGDKIARQALEQCDEALAKFWNHSVVALLGDTDSRALEDVAIVQPLTFAVQVMLARVWESWGIRPSACIGHSMGEVAAAHVAGALPLEDAARVICERSALLRRARGRGAMVLVEATESEARRLVAPTGHAVSVAAINDRHSVVLSGDPAAIDQILSWVERSGRFCRRVSVDVASHSPQMDALAGPLMQALEGLNPTEPTSTLYSTVTGDTAPLALDGEYWTRNLRQPVRFAAASEAAVRDGHRIFVEVSPHPVLVHSLDKIVRDLGMNATIVASFRREEDERRTLLQSAGQLYEAGLDLNWPALYPDRRRVVSLPSYPWLGERFWTDNRTATRDSTDRPTHLHDTAGSHTLAAADAPTRTYVSTELGLSTHRALEHHRICGQTLIPAAFFANLALERLGAGTGDAMSVRLVIQEALVVDDGERELQMVDDRAIAGRARLRFYSRPRDGAPEQWTLHCTVDATSRPGRESDLPETAPVLSAAHCQDHTTLYQTLSRRGLQYGGPFKSIDTVHTPDSVLWASVRPMRAEGSEAGWVARVASIDACLQAVVLSLPHESLDTWLPTEIGDLRLHAWAEVGDAPLCRVDPVAEYSRTADRYSANVTLVTQDGKVLLEATGVTLRRVTTRTLEDHLLYSVTWTPAGVPAARSTRPATSIARCTVVFDDEAGTAWRLLTPAAQRTAIRLRVEDAVQAPGVLQRIASAHDRVEVVHAWNLELGSEAALNDMTQVRRIGVTSLLHVVQELLTRCEVSRLVIVTRGAQRVGDDDAVTPAQAPAWGFASVIRSEFPEIPCITLDLDPAATPDVTLARQAIDACESSDSLAIRRGRVMSQRLDRQPPTAAPRTRLERWRGEPVRFRVATPGDLDSIAAGPLERSEPEPHEVEIEVIRTGLNFMNVLSAYGEYFDYDNGVGPLGIECVGRVLRAGVDTAFRPGDRVVAYALDSLATHVTIDARLAAAVPAVLSDDEAVTLPLAFMTAWYALVHLARLERGERVLIHSGAGGVGHAAIQIAHWIGAEVIATAGTVRKREYLRQIGVRHVFDSRSMRFAQDVEERTAGAGVDVVLNSLAGDAIEAGLSTLAHGGRFVELGKRDIHDDRLLALGAFRANISFFAVDLDRFARERPAFLGGLLREVMARVADGTFAPLPYQVFAAGRAPEAFRTMAAGEHIGKLVIDMRASPQLMVRSPVPGQDWSAGTIVITGGLGVLGLIVARWLTQRGARSLVLAGRHTPNAAAGRIISELRAAGTDVRVVECDVSRRQEVEHLLAVARSVAPLRAVFHVAGILDDALLERMDDERLEKAMSAKVSGGWHLHELTAADGLDAFVLFSSVSGFIGSAGQGNYAAANAFLDALAHHRQRRGLPALSVQWGPWANRGLASEASRGARLQQIGLGSLSEDEALAVLERLLSTDIPVMAAMRFEARRWIHHAPGATNHRLFDLLARDGGANRDMASDLRGELASVTPTARQALIEERVRAAVARVIRSTGEQIPSGASFRALGLDSLMALELRRVLEADTGVKLASTLMWNHPTVRELAGYLAERLAPRGRPHDGVHRDPEAADAELEAVLQEVEGLSDEQVQRLSAGLRDAEGTNRV